MIIIIIIMIIIIIIMILLAMIIIIIIIPKKRGRGYPRNPLPRNTPKKHPDSKRLEHVECIIL